MPQVTDTGSIIEIREDMTWGRRAMFLLLGFFPLIAPYELLIRPGWTSIISFFFLLSLLISLGAIFLSGFLFFIAFAGLSTLLRFDADTRIFTYIHHAPIVPFRRELISFDAIEGIEVEKHDWTDGEPSFSLRVNLLDKKSFKSASFPYHGEAKEALERIEQVMKA